MSAAGRSTISVALTTCNSAAYLPAQLASIAAQTRPPDEIVIGDDQSSDETPAIVQGFAASHPIPVHWERNPARLGISSNFERVAGRCRGDIVAFSDHDDVWMPQKLARLEAALAARPGAAFAFSDGWLIDGQGARLPGTLFSSVGFGARDRQRFAGGGAVDVLLRYNVVTGAAMAVRREALNRVLPFERGWLHDYYLALALSILGEGVMLEEPLIQYRRHASQHIGVAGSDVGAVLVLARRQGAAHYQQQAENFDRLRARLLALGVKPDHRALAGLAGKAAFMRSLAELRAHRLRAPLTMWRGWRQGDYTHYGQGWKQGLLDLLSVGVSLVPGKIRRS